MSGTITPTLNPDIEAALPNITPPTTSKPPEPAKKALPQHIAPDNCIAHDNPLPTIENPNAVTGIYYNVLFPAEGQNQGKPDLFKWLLSPQSQFIDSQDFNTVSLFSLGSIPKKILAYHFAHHMLCAIKEGIPFEDALKQALNKLEEIELPKIRESLCFLKSFQDKESISTLRGRYQHLMNGIEDSLKNLKKSVSYKLIQDTFNNEGPEKAESLLKKLNTVPKKAIIREKNTFDFRSKVLAKAVDDIVNKTPESPFFLGLQEVTPDALVTLKDKLKEKNLTWVSFNNLTEKETSSVTAQTETVLGESEAFTSTIALSPELKVQSVALASLPSPSGSLRKILGVTVINTKTEKSFTIFSTHIDHIITPGFYSDTAQAIHTFTSQFPSPWIMGGDFNVFAGSGGEEFYTQLKRDDQDYRQTNFYVDRTIENVTFTGKGSSPFSPKMEQQKDLSWKMSQSNALDQIFLRDLNIIAATRNAAVHDDRGELLDPYGPRREEYYKHLQKMDTASDHLMNAIVFQPKQ